MFGVRFARLTAMVLALGLVAAACGDDGSSDGGQSSGTTAATATTAPKAPVKGGSITFATFSEAQSLDPVKTSGAGTTAGNETAAIYDRLVFWNPDKNQYEPRLAESFTNNADFTEFTLKIRPNIKFGDGTAYDAAAVKFNLDRQKASNAILRGVLANMKEVTVVDALTVKIALTDSWPGFLTLLSNSLGFIASPTAIQKLGTTFETNPVGAGAGPFEIGALKAKESLTLKRNPAYWNGDVYLDEIKFVFLPGGAPAAYQALKNGTIDVAFLREPVPVAQAATDGYPGVSTIMNLGEILVMNNGVEVTCTGGKPEPLCVGQADGTKLATKAPGQNKKARQAVQLALDVNAINTRANEGKGLPGLSVFDKSFPWDPKVATSKQNLDQAKKLVTEAKSEGWDGKIRLSCTNTPQRQGVALSVQAMLQNVGIEVDMTRSNLDVNQVIADVITNRNYDLACWGLSIPADDWAFTQLESFLRSTSGSNRTGYKSPAMDAALAELKKAATTETKTAAYKKIADLFVADVPSVIIGAVEERLVYRKDLKGVAPASFTTIELSKAWIDK
jgi:peptide/nickel transport system substrate-binding protein